ncbi:MAG: hypothetical protein IJI41_06075 [Anaerolineaceae bacterium]|nr:hypothetical protein [Anaerolineaceae bacterium]
MKHAGIPKKIFSILALLALIFLLIPMLKAAQYNVPSADDYDFAFPAYKAWEQTRSVIEVIRTAWDNTLSVYKNWQGSFTAVFLFSTNPMLFGEQYYQLTTWIILGMLLFGIFYLTFNIWQAFFQADKYECLIIAVVWSVICTQFLPRSSQGFYWHNGSVYYTFFFGLSLCGYAIIVRYIVRRKNDKGIGKLLLSSLILFFIGGGNLVTGLTTSVLLVSMELLLIRLKNKNWKPLLIPTLLFSIAFGLNVSAPGNAVRQRFFGKPRLLESIFISFREACLWSVKWFSLPVICLILLLIPVMWMIIQRTKYQFPFPGLVTLYSVCLAAVMFYPPIYAETARTLPQLSRLTNIIFYAIIFLAIFNLFYWLGWLGQKGKIPEQLFRSAQVERYNFVFLVIILVCFCFGMTRIKWYDTTSISAFRSYRSGQMGNYWHTYELRLEILKDPEIKDAVLKRFPSRPYVLFYRELSEYPDGNATVASWYNKNSVVIR